MRIRLKLDRLIEELSRSNRTQNHWAIKLGLSRGHLSELLNGKHPYPSQKTREKLIVGLALEFGDLFEAEADTEEWSHASSASFQAALSGRYLIDEEIGRGGMGTVYLAREVKHGRRVAIKVISPEAVTGVGAKQFLKETRYTAQLQHHNILTLLDSGEAAGYPYYVMPYIPGGSLRDRLRTRAPLSVEETLSIARGVAAALAYAHDNRVVHCDVKPENILLSDDHALVADFGIARAVHAEVRALGLRSGIDSSAGTPAYVSPEQASGDPHVDARTDVYSLGCVLFEMLVGEAPFTGTTTVEVVSRRFTDAVPDAAERGRHVPRAVSGVIRKAMALDPTQRYGSVTQCADALLRAAAHGRRPIRDAVGLVWAKTRARVRGRTTVPRAGGRQESVWLRNVLQDVIYALRGFRKNAAQTAVLLSTLALAIGVNSAVFSVFSTVLLRPLPFPDPDRLVAITEGTRGGTGRFTSSYANFADVRDQNTHFEAVAGFVGTEESVVGGDVPVFASARYVTGDFFRVLGVAPQIGAPGLDVAEDGQTALIGDALWRDTFGADPDVLGREIEVSGRQLTIIGVMPPGFAFPRTVQVWLPFDLHVFFGDSRSVGGINMIGRLHEDASLASAGAELSALAGRLSAAYPNELANRDFLLIDLHDQLAGRSRSTLVLLVIVVGVILLIACGNIAGILLSQSTTRAKEMALRRAVGASAGRILTQLLTESALIGLVGALLGLGLALMSMRLLNAFVPAGYLHSGAIVLDWRVLVFTLVLGVVAGFACGLVPAWRATRYDPSDALRTDSNDVAVGGKRRRAGELFVVPQYAFSLAALVVAGLILKSLFVLNDVDPGFATQGLFTASLDLPVSSPRYDDPQGIGEFHRMLVAQIEAVPGVRSASLEYSPPMVVGPRVVGAVQPEYVPPEEFRFGPEWRTVALNYFRTMGIPLVQGRLFQQSDAIDAPRVVIVNQALARRMWGDEDPVGKRLRPRLNFLAGGDGTIQWMTVVGVAADVRHRGLALDPEPAVYTPAAQHPRRARSMDVIVAVDGDPGTFGAAFRRVIYALDPELPVGRIDTMERVVYESATAPRFRARLLAGFGGLAVLLVVLGMYGVMAYAVSQRRREMALRVALGAQRNDILRMVTGEGLRFVIFGQILGVAIALAFTRLLEGLLFGVAATDGVVFWTVSPLLAIVVLLTCYIPARRAGSVDPVEVLRA